LNALVRRQTLIPQRHLRASARAGLLPGGERSLTPHGTSRYAEKRFRRSASLPGTAAIGGERDPK